MAAKSEMQAVELSKSEIMVLAKHHRKHGNEMLELAKMVEEEGISADDMRYLAAKRYSRVLTLMRIAHDMPEMQHVPA
jgi:cell division protein YceG involved in septum cleavage